MAIWWDFTAGVWKRHPMVETLRHYNFGINVVFETLELYIYILSVPSSAGSQRGGESGDNGRQQRPAHRLRPGQGI